MHPQKLKISLIAFLILFWSVSALPSDSTYIGSLDIPPDMWGGNPFLTTKEETETQAELIGAEDGAGADIPEVLSYLKLEAIFWGSKDKKAVINGQIVKIGDKILGNEIVDITPKSVVIEIKHHRWEVPLQNLVK